MLQKTATRFAEASLQIYGAQGQFTTSVETEDDMESVAQAFETLGCQVEREPFRTQLQVTPPTVE